VQTFHQLAAYSGGIDKQLLLLDRLFDGIAANPLKF